MSSLTFQILLNEFPELVDCKDIKDIIEDKMKQPIDKFIFMVNKFTTEIINGRYYGFICIMSWINIEMNHMGIKQLIKAHDTIFNTTDEDTRKQLAMSYIVDVFLLYGDNLEAHGYTSYKSLVKRLLCSLKIIDDILIDDIIQYSKTNDTWYPTGDYLEYIISDDFRLKFKNDALYPKLIKHMYDLIYTNINNILQHQKGQQLMNIFNFALSVYDSHTIDLLRSFILHFKHNKIQIDYKNVYEKLTKLVNSSDKIGIIETILFLKILPKPDKEWNCDGLYQKLFNLIEKSDAKDYYTARQFIYFISASIHKRKNIIVSKELLCKIYDMIMLKSTNIDNLIKKLNSIEKKFNYPRYCLYYTLSIGNYNATSKSLIQRLFDKYNVKIRYDIFSKFKNKMEQITICEMYLQNCEHISYKWLEQLANHKFLKDNKLIIKTISYMDDICLKDAYTKLENSTYRQFISDEMNKRKN